MIDSYEIVDLDIDELLQFYKKEQFLSEKLQNKISNNFAKYREKSNQLYIFLAKDIIESVG